MNTDMINPDRIFSVLEVGELTGAGRFNVLRWIHKGQLPAIRRSNFFLIYGRDLLDTLAREKAGEFKLDWSRSGRRLVTAL